MEERPGVVVAFAAPEGSGGASPIPPSSRRSSHGQGSRPSDRARRLTSARYPHRICAPDGVAAISAGARRASGRYLRALPQDQELPLAHERPSFPRTTTVLLDQDGPARTAVEHADFVRSAVRKAEAGVPATRRPGARSDDNAAGGHRLHARRVPDGTSAFTGNALSCCSSREWCDRERRRPLSLIENCIDEERAGVPWSEPAQGRRCRAS